MIAADCAILSKHTQSVCVESFRQVCTSVIYNQLLTETSLFISLSLSLSCVCASFYFAFEDEMWELIVLVPNIACTKQNPWNRQKTRHECSCADVSIFVHAQCIV